MNTARGRFDVRFVSRSTKYCGSWEWGF